MYAYNLLKITPYVGAELHLPVNFANLEDCEMIAREVEKAQGYKLIPVKVIVPSLES